MTTTMTLNHDHHTTTPTSIITPIPAMVIEIKWPQSQYINHQNVPCVHCGQCIQHHASDEEKKKKEMNDEVIFVKEEKPDIIFVKEEKPDASQLFNNIEEEEYTARNDIDERVFHQDISWYSNIYSPISVPGTVHAEKEDLLFYEVQDRFFDNHMNTRFESYTDIVEYLKADLGLM